MKVNHNKLLLDELAVVGNSVRLAILQNLEHSVSPPSTKQLAQAVGVRESVLSHHVSILRQAGFVQTVMSGSYAHHIRDERKIKRLIGSFSEALLQGDASEDQ